MSGGAVIGDLVARAKAGSEDAFRELIAPYRRELHVHCYRILGSTHDAEDAMQETLLAAWRGLGGFEARASVRTWLYRIATNRCLNLLRAGRRSTKMEQSEPMAELPAPSRLGEALWLEPYPDALLDELEDAAPNPEARYETKEALSLAFVTALQLLPPRQRAVLLLRDVLGFHAREVARMLDATEESVTSALKRARAALDRERASWVGREPAAAPGSPEEQALVERLMQAFEASDVDRIVALLTDDVRLTMPPLPFEYEGLELAGRFFATATLGGRRRYRLIPTRANGQPAFGFYIRDPGASVFHAIGLLVLTLAGSRVCEMTRFDNSALELFGLPRSLPA
jgi:RNA polymerase sigma-70 factor (TIGR02960 family)